MSPKPQSKKFFDDRIESQNTVRNGRVASVKQNLRIRKDEAKKVYSSLVTKEELAKVSQTAKSRSQ